MKLSVIERGDKRPADYFEQARPKRKGGEQVVMEFVQRAVAQMGSQGAVAERIGVSRASIGHWCLGRATPSQVHLDAIAKIVGQPAPQGYVRRGLPVGQHEAARRQDVAKRACSLWGRQEVAHHTGVCAKHVSRWSRGRQPVPDHHIDALEELARGQV
jgi:DNA-binding transcriptional regulator YdaS (Cro superfamily)